MIAISNIILIAIIILIIIIIIAISKITNSYHYNSYAPVRSVAGAPKARARRSRPFRNMAGVNMVLFNPCLNLMYSARIMLTPTMFSRRQAQPAVSEHGGERLESRAKGCDVQNPTRRCPLSETWIQFTFKCPAGRPSKIASASKLLGRDVQNPTSKGVPRGISARERSREEVTSAGRPGPIYIYI